MNEKIMEEIMANWIEELSTKDTINEKEAKILEELIKQSKEMEKEKMKQKMEYQREKFKQEAENTREKQKLIMEYMRMGVDVATVLIPAAIFAVLFQQGLKFEETGVFASVEMKDLIKNIGKLIKVR